MGSRTRYRMGGRLTVTSHGRDNFSEGKTLIRGYNAMLEKIEPSKIICFGTPFPEMDGNIITVDYADSRKAVG